MMKNDAEISKIETIFDVKCELKFAVNVLSRIKYSDFEQYKKQIPCDGDDFKLIEIYSASEWIKRPTELEIARMERCLSWFDELAEFEKELVWRRANGVPWKVICYDMGFHRSNLSEKHNVALAKILGGIRKNTRA